MNPAEELSWIFQQWNDRNGPANDQIDLRTANGHKKAMRALRLTFEIHDLLGLLQRSGMNMEVYHKPLEQWQKAILHYPRNWTTSALSIPNQDMLQGLALLLDTAVPNMRISKDALRENSDELVKRLDELKVIFGQDDSLGQVFRSHAIWLVDRLCSAITAEDPILYAEFIEGIRLLKVYVSAAAEDSNSFKDKYREWIGDFFRHPFANTVLTLGGTAGMHAIGMV